MNRLERSAYSPYGFAAEIRSAHTLLGFNGEHAQALTPLYLLGSGYRVYNTRLMRFLSPDSLSPFDAGGMNTYAYCSNDPVNRSDPTGHSFLYPNKNVRRPAITLPSRGEAGKWPTHPSELAKRDFSNMKLKEMSYKEIQHWFKISKGELKEAKRNILRSPNDASEAIEKYVKTENRHHVLTEALNSKITGRLVHVIESLLEEGLYKPSMPVESNAELATLMRNGMPVIIPSVHDFRTVKIRH
ncbi:RHS repeat-associated core domain-containing protein [Pseudomonas fulva]|uniref:RHS repeat-associated core domain-containing protein n=1 Tax=Pseudomonas fulva TaxID=47880 RepID=UPI0009B98923|nr:RHS repeat-associated core domain-containing protein [Pseudomonas fulva]